MPNCSGLAGRLFGHRYQPRYSIEEHKTPSLFDAPYFSVTGKGGKLEIPQNFYKKTYHGDICPRCGSVTNDPTHGKTA